MSYENIPAEMKAYNNWLVWRLEERGGKPNKTPYSVKGGYGKVNNPSTWGSFEQAVQAQQRDKYSGIGFVFTNTPFIGIDIDNSLVEGTPTAEAAEAIDTLKSYTELSQSGKGFHIVAKGTLPDGRRRNGAFEMYGEGSPRYFAMTGNLWGAYWDIEANQQAINAVHQRFIAEGEKQPPHGERTGLIDKLSDIEAINKAKAAKNGKKISKLLNGDISGYKSHSEADQALCNLLAFYCGDGSGSSYVDPIMLDRLFRQSGLYRKDKWDERRGERGTYGEITINNAIDGCRETYKFAVKAEKQPSQTNKQDEYAPQLIRASDIEFEPPKWLISPYFQRGKGTLIQADNGVGKTAFMCAITAHVSTGRPVLDIPIQKPGDVLLLSVEDDLPVLRGRIEANGGDLTRCHFMANAAGLTFNSPEVEAAIKSVQARLIIFDPFQAFLGASVNMDKSNQTRPELAKLFEMAARNDCSVAIIAHQGKDGFGKSAVNRALGSVDIPAAMRSILQLGRNPDNESEIIAVHVKSSNAPKGRSLAFSIGDRGGVNWSGYSSLTSEDLSTINLRKEKGIDYEDEPIVIGARAFITQNSTGGKITYDEFHTLCVKEAGIAPYADNRDAAYKIPAIKAEMMKRDRLLIETGVFVKRSKGISITPYASPTSFQIEGWRAGATETG